MTEPNRQMAWRLISWCLEPFADLSLGSVLMEASLDTQSGPFHVHPGLAEAATNCGSPYTFKQVAQSQSQAESDIDLPLESKRPQNQHTWWWASDHNKA